MKKLAQKISLALLVTASAGLTTAHAAPDGDATNLQDASIYAVIGLAPVISMNCVGVNMGIHRLTLARPYSGTFTVAAADNLSGTTSSKSYFGSGMSGAAQAYDSQPETGKCILTGLISPDPADYSMALTLGDAVAFVSGTETDVSNPSAVRTAAVLSEGGMNMRFSMASATPALENIHDLVWRINGVVSFIGLQVGGGSGYGGYKTESAAKVEVNPAN